VPAGHRLEGDAVAIAPATIEWYAPKETDLIKSHGTLILPRVTSGMQAGFAQGTAIRLERVGEGDRFVFSPDMFRNLQETTHLQLEHCDQPLDRGSLCGIPQPWTLLSLSAPWIEGNKASVTLEVIEVSGSSTGGAKPSTDAVMWDVYLERQNGKWVVVSGRISGVS
jgi:hypothetical protein